MLTKENIRACIKHKRKQIGEGLLDEASRKVTNHMSMLKAFQEARTVFLYAAFKNEIQTKYLHEFAKCQGKKIAYPKIESQAGEMNFYEVDDLKELQATTFKSMQINEPDCNRHSKVFPVSTDIMIVPGLAFDLKGNRVGYGGGFYDRYFHQHTTIYKIGVCMDFQVFAEIRTESFDVKVDYIVSENRSYLPFE